MTATTNSSGCRARRYSPIPTCAPRWAGRGRTRRRPAQHLACAGQPAWRRPHEMRRAVRAATLELIGATASSSAAW